jgi:hypothetical protein
LTLRTRAMTRTGLRHEEGCTAAVCTGTVAHALPENPMSRLARRDIAGPRSSPE